MEDQPFFIGQYKVTVDDKGRFLIPADVRNELDDSRADKGGSKNLILITGANGHLWLYPETFYKRYVAPKNRSPVPNADVMAYTLMLHSGSARLIPDKAGRVLLSDNAVDRQRLGRNCMMIGAGEHLELWAEEEWNEFVRQNRPRTAELAMRFKSSMGM